MAQLNAGCSRGHHTYVLVVNETAIDTAANTSTVSFSIRLDGTNGYNWAGWGSSIGCNYSINGTTRTITIPQWGSGYSPSSGVVIQSGTQVIPHNEDGTKTITLSISGFDNAGKSYTPGTASNSMTMTLTPIDVSKDMNIRIGNNIIKKAYVGTTEVKEVFFGETNIFPGYTKLEYIQSSGGQYIKTGVNDSNDSAICCKFYTANPNNNYMFGSRQNGSLMLYNGLYSNNQLEYNWQTINYTANNTIEMTQTVVGTTNTIKINNQTFTKSTGSVSAYEIFIFACNNSSVRYYTGTTRCYYFKMYRGNTLIRDFIPVKRKTDNKVGLYDLVEHKFYGNSGSGDFTAGPEV